MMKSTIKINVTNICNLNCEYCYVDKNNQLTLSISTIHTVLSNVRRFSDMYDKRCLFFGGEPSLVHNLISEVMDLNYDFTFDIISNGYRLFNYHDIEFYNRFENCTISIEGTEKAYNILRSSKNLSNHIDKIIELNRFRVNNSKPPVIANVSFNGILNDNIDEFINNIEKLTQQGVSIHFYSLRGENHFEGVHDISHLLESLPIRISNKIIRIDDYNISNSDYLCGYSNMMSVSCEGNLCACEDSDYNWGPAIKKDNYCMLPVAISENHKDNWIGCKTCVVPVSMCECSCPLFIKECYDNGNIELLNKCCELEMVKEYYRKIRKGENNGIQVSSRSSV